MKREVLWIETVGSDLTGIQVSIFSFPFQCINYLYLLTGLSNSVCQHCCVITAS